MTKHMRWLTQHRVSLLGAMALAMASCDRTAEPKTEGPHPPRVAPSTPPAPAAPAPGIQLPSLPRLIAIGDIHGDLSALRQALRLGGAIDAEDDWIGKGLTVVQTGDQLDRGDQDRQVLDLLEKLERDAKSKGGDLIVLNGNHELMNAVLDFRYVTRQGLSSFDDLAHSAPTSLAEVPDPQKGRATAFAPGGVYASKLARHQTIALVGDTLFVHGGVLPAHIDYGLGRINAEASAFLSGKRPELPRVLASDDSPVWTRVYGEPDPSAAVCELLGRVLQQVGATRMVVGHTVQKDGISSACGDRLFRIDVGLSAFYGDNPTQILEISGGKARVLGARTSERAPPGRTVAERNGKAPAPALH